MRDVEVLEIDSTPKSASTEIDPTDPFGFDSRDKATIFLHETASWLADYHDISLAETARNGWIEGSMPIGRQSCFVGFALSIADRHRGTTPASITVAIAENAIAALARYTHIQS